MKHCHCTCTSHCYWSETDCQLNWSDCSAGSGDVSAELEPELLARQERRWGSFSEDEERTFKLNFVKLSEPLDQVVNQENI